MRTLEEIAEIDQLLDQHMELWRIAIILQGNPEETKQFVPALQEHYHAWYYRALTVLPEDMRPRFIEQYEGLPEKGAWNTTVVVGIRQFLEDPLDRYEVVDFNARLTKHAPPPKPPEYAWRYPFDYYFKPKFLVQVHNLRAAKEFYRWSKSSARPASPGASEAVSTEDMLRSRTVFVGHGHGTLYLVVVDFLRTRLGLSVDTFESEPTGGLHNIKRSEDLLDRAGFAVIVATGDDVTADGQMQARLNVIHELGLFQGRLGFQNVALMRQEGTREFSNLSGYQELRFNGEEIRGKFEELRGMLRREKMQFNEPAT
jgi:predicted nucleotide-binding protein